MLEVFYVVFVSICKVGFKIFAKDFTHFFLQYQIVKSILITIKALIEYIDDQIIAKYLAST